MIIAVGKSRVMDRSWLFIAITRAKRKAVFVGDEALIQEAIDLGNVADKRQVDITFEDANAN